MGRRDWWEWHRTYQDPTSGLSRRLSMVNHQLRAALDRCPEGAIKLISLCAGQGRDVLTVLRDHPRRRDVTARLVELDPRNVRRARQDADRLDGPTVVVVRADAGVTNAYVGAVPAHVVLVCGVFGNLPMADIEQTVDALPSLCAERATVIWTRHRRPPDATPAIRARFEAAGFLERSFEGPAGTIFAVGAHQFTGRPQTVQPGRRLFTFSDGGDSAREPRASAPT